MSCWSSLGWQLLWPKLLTAKLQGLVKTSVVTRNIHLKCGVFVDCLTRALAVIALNFLSVGKKHTNYGTLGISHTSDEILAKCRHFSEGLSLSEPPPHCLVSESLWAALQGWRGFRVWISEQHLDDIPPEKYPIPTVGHILSLSHPVICTPFQFNHFLPTICCLNSTVRMTYLNTPLWSNGVFPSKLITFLNVKNLFSENLSYVPDSAPVFLLISKIIIIAHMYWLLPECQALG